jgi:hypothetical protein
MVAETSRRYYQENTATHKARSLQYYSQNKKTRSDKMRLWYSANADKVAKNVQEYRTARPGFVAAKQAKRRAALLQATPAWADLKVIEEIYRDAATRLEVFHVDHIVPLNSPVVCGLHCEANLQILAARDNLVKSNSIWPHMP